MVHCISVKSLQTFHIITPTRHKYLVLTTSNPSISRKMLNITLNHSHLPTFYHVMNLKFVKFLDSKMTKASKSTPCKSAKEKSAPTLSRVRTNQTNSKEGIPYVIIYDTPITTIPAQAPTKGRSRTPAPKREKPSILSESSNPTSNVRDVETTDVVKKPHNMTSLYLDPITTTNFELNVGTSAKEFDVSNVVGSIKTYEKPTSENVNLDNLGAEESLGQSSVNIATKNIVNDSDILSVDREADVVPDVKISLGNMTLLSRPHQKTLLVNLKLSLCLMS